MFLHELARSSGLPSARTTDEHQRGEAQTAVSSASAMTQNLATSDPIPGRKRVSTLNLLHCRDSLSVPRHHRMWLLDRRPLPFLQRRLSFFQCVARSSILFLNAPKLLAFTGSFLKGTHKPQFCTGYKRLFSGIVRNSLFTINSLRSLGAHGGHRAGRQKDVSWQG